MTEAIRKTDIVAEGQRLLVLRREFAAPRALVWRAFTEPELMKRWMLAREAPMILCEQDFRPGGRLRMVWKLKDGEMGLSGRFVEIDPPERMVHTELFDEDWTEGETTITTRFEDHGSFTRVEMRIEYSSAEAREGAMGTDMTDGMENTYAKLDAMLRETSP